MSWYNLRLKPIDEARKVLREQESILVGKMEVGGGDGPAVFFSQGIKPVNYEGVEPDFCCRKGGKIC
jgi:hypothetical protein